MQHPRTRAPRRFFRQRAQLKYNRRLRRWCGPEAVNNLLWNHGGKRCEAHGNRCAHRICQRLDNAKLAQQLLAVLVDLRSQ